MPNAALVEGGVVVFYGAGRGCDEGRRGTNRKSPLGSSSLLRSITNFPEGKLGSQVTTAI